MPYTRILGHELSNFVGQRVSLTGEVLDIDGHKVTIRTADNEEIMINNLKLTPITTKYIDAIGEAQVDSVIADQVVNAGDNIDLELLKRVIGFARQPRFAGLFTPAQSQSEENNSS
ncbi:hypothetical protein PM082_004755 [Marasmius tenuissimus]|nr:hypothetical protein PM082_004755 [Marasmius tenuissimus]